jgi:hypothetical protein
MPLLPGPTNRSNIPINAFLSYSCSAPSPFSLRSPSVLSPFFLRFIGTEGERSKSGEGQENEGNKMGERLMGEAIKRYFRSIMKRKTSFPFAFCSLIRNFGAKFKKERIWE